jgi:hypothetical protein
VRGSRHLSLDLGKRAPEAVVVHELALKLLVDAGHDILQVDALTLEHGKPHKEDRFSHCN